MISKKNSPVVPTADQTKRRGPIGGAALLSGVLLGASCGPELPSSTAGGVVLDAGAGAGEGGAGGSGGSAGAICPAGQAPDGDGACQPVGIQGCVDRFIDADGICRPSMAKCADQPGTIPKFEEGCVPVGILDCAPEFLEDDGLCHPRTEKCAAEPGTFAVPQLGCVHIDGPLGCGSDTWGNIADGLDALYVNPSYQGAASDGTKAQPFKTINEAIAVAPAGGRVALAAGVYTEPVLIIKTMTLEGRCPSMVKINAKGSIYAVIDVIDAAGVALRGFEVGGDGIGISANNAPGLSIERVHVREATSVGVYLEGAATTATISYSIVEGTVPVESLEGDGSGVYADDISQLNLAHSAILNNCNYGAYVSVDEIAQVEIIDSLIEGTLPKPWNLGSGRGIGAYGYGDVSLSLEGSALVRNHEAGIHMDHEGMHGELRHNLIEDTQPRQNDFNSGVGALIRRGAVAKLEGNAILRNTYAGARARDQGSILETAGNLIAETVCWPTVSQKGIGLWIQAQARGKLVGDVVYHNRAAGLFVDDDAASVTATRLLIEDTQSSSASAEDGAGVLVFVAPGPVTLSSCAIVGNLITAVGVGPLSHTILFDSLLAGTKSGSFVDPDGALHKDFGDGLVAMFGADVTIERTIVERVDRAGIVFDQSTGLIASCDSRENQFGVVIQGTPRPSFTLEQSSVHDNLVEDYVSGGELAIPTQIPGAP